MQDSFIKYSLTDYATANSANNEAVIERFDCFCFSIDKREPSLIRKIHTHNGSHSINSIYSQLWLCLEEDLPI